MSMISSTFDAPGVPPVPPAISASGAEFQTKCVAVLLQIAERVLAIVVFLLAAGFALGLMNKSPLVTRWMIPGAGLLADLAILLTLLIPFFKADDEQRDEGRDITIAGTVMLAISIIWVLLA